METILKTTTSRSFWFDTNQQQLVNKTPTVVMETTTVTVCKYYTKHFTRTRTTNNNIVIQIHSSF